MASNLPPGVTEGMLPGNRPEDWGWDALLDDISSDSDTLGLDADEARIIWEMGKKAYQAIKDADYRMISNNEFRELHNDIEYKTNLVERYENAMLDEKKK